MDCGIDGKEIEAQKCDLFQGVCVCGYCLKLREDDLNLEIQDGHGDD